MAAPFHLIHTLHDYDHLAAIEDRLHPGQAHAAEFYQQADAGLEPHIQRHRWLVCGAAGKWVGHAGISHDPYFFHPHRLVGVVSLLPETGQESAVTQHLQSEARRLRAETLKLLIPEDRTALLQAAQAQGFREIYRSFWQLHTLVDFNAEAYPRQIPGIQLLRLSEWKDPDYRRKIYELDQAVLKDIPMTEDRPPPTFEAFWKYTDRVSPKRDTFFIALDGTQLVGAHQVYINPGSDHYVVATTGVLPAYRRRGICTALKAWGMRTAKEAGAHGIRTYNDSLNTAVLALNRKFGFVPGPAECAWLKELAYN